MSQNLVGEREGERWVWAGQSGGEALVSAPGEVAAAVFTGSPTGRVSLLVL